jgi:arylsulfatase A-like enzyme
MISLLLVAALGAIAPQAPASRPPNFVVVFCDDLGSGDLGAVSRPRGEVRALRQLQ